MIYLGCDHGGYELMEEVVLHLKAKEIPFEHMGCDSKEAVDYPVYGQKVAKKVANGEKEDFGILICGTGIGISIVANKEIGIRAALCGDVFSAKMTREHNDANILVMGGRVVGAGLALEIVDTFLNTDFSKEQRHIDRISMIEQ